MPNNRDRAWRRAQRSRVMANRCDRYNFDPILDVRSIGQLAKNCPANWDNATIEKNWKLIYQRRNKLSRVKQLGNLWPHPHRELQMLVED